MNCPYTGQVITRLNSEPDHIIPLSLGGSNMFVVRCQKKFNNDFGSRVEQQVLNHPMFQMGLQPKVSGHRKPKEVKWLGGNLFEKSAPRFQGRPVQYRYENGKLAIVDRRSGLLISNVINECGIITHFPNTANQELLLTLKAFLGLMRFYHTDDPLYLDLDEIRRLLQMAFKRSEGTAIQSSIGYLSASLIAAKDAKQASRIHKSFGELCPRNASFLFLLCDGDSIHFSLACRGLHIGSLLIPLTQHSQKPPADSGTAMLVRGSGIVVMSLWNYLNRYVTPAIEHRALVKHDFPVGTPKPMSDA